MNTLLALLTFVSISATSSFAASCTNDLARMGNLSPTELSNKLATYSSSRATERLTSTLIQNDENRSGELNTIHGGRCLHAVKVGLQGSWTNQYLSGLAAENAGPQLESIGFTNLLCHPDNETLFVSPADAPNGAVLVYDGGTYGHIEVRVKNDELDGFISDYYCSTSRTGSPQNGRIGHPTISECDPYLAKESRRLIGIYVHL